MDMLVIPSSRRMSSQIDGDELVVQGTMVRKQAGIKECLQSVRGG